MQTDKDFVFKLTLYLKECISKDYSMLTKYTEETAIEKYAKDIVKFFEENS
jgi:hypothetical protein